MKNINIDIWSQFNTKLDDRLWAQLDIQISYGVSNQSHRHLRRWLKTQTNDILRLNVKL